MYLTTAFCLIFTVLTTAYSLKICAPVSKSRECDILDVGSLVSCVRVEDSLDCAMKIEAKEADFGAFTSEELIASSKYMEDYAVVIGELRDSQVADKKYAYQTVAVVKSDFTGGLTSLKDKNYCHPGIVRSTRWTDYVMKYFEQKVLESFPPVSTCDADWRTSAENEHYRLSTLFKKACRPGDWTVNKWITQNLVHEFSNLCSLCNNPSLCSYGETKLDPHISALECLTKRKGDVAYVALDYVRQYFNLNGSSTPLAEAQEYKFLCPNGTTASLSQDTDCTWISQPWKSIVVNKIAGDEILSNITAWYSASSEKRYEFSQTIKLILGDKYEVFKPMLPIYKISSYIQRGREVPQIDETEKCEKKLVWCTQSANENIKCDRLRYAALSHGVKPDFRCSQPKKLIECLQDIKDSKVDFVSSNSTNGYVARMNYNNSASVFVETTKDGNYYGIILLKSDSNVKYFADLRGKRACFPQYNGLGWLNFVQTAKNSDVVSKYTCPESTDSWTYFSSACAPGAKESDINPFYYQVPDSMCAQCNPKANQTDSRSRNPYNRDTCAPLARNLLYGDDGAVRCLAWNYGDVAFVDYFAAKDYIDQGGDEIEANNFKVLCKDGTILPLKQIDRIKCSTLIVNGQEVLVHKNNPVTKERNIRLLLETLDHWFGKSFSHMPTMSLYGTFNGERNVLFTTNGAAFSSKYSTENPYVNNYQTVQSTSDHCWYKSSAFTLYSSLLTTVLLLLSVVVINV